MAIVQLNAPTPQATIPYDRTESGSRPSASEPDASRWICAVVHKRHAMGAEMDAANGEDFFLRRLRRPRIYTPCAMTQVNSPDSGPISTRSICLIRMFLRLARIQPVFAARSIPTNSLPGRPYAIGIKLAPVAPSNLQNAAVFHPARDACPTECS
jgi:hypothetical protein